MTHRPRPADPPGQVEPQKRLDLATLVTASRSELQADWQAATGRKSPRWLSTDLLQRALAYRLQLAALGGTRRNAERRQGTSDRPSSVRRRPLAIGTRLVREWGGTTHVVDVTNTGLQWAGRTYGSLSEIARAITGTHWSGPRFFGLVGGPKPSTPP